MAFAGEQLDAFEAFNQVTVPDLWQQKAVSALREGKDVVVHAPTGSGKTLIFELWANQGKPHGRAVYTVPTRALANDKLGEWRRRGWNVGIATGDLSDNLDAPIIVATLETQKRRLLQGDGPNLLVVDEYQMIGDQDRGLNYELSLALAPPGTQFLMLSGSVENPQHIVQWLNRLGRNAIVVRHTERPVPMEEVNAGNLNVHVPREVRGYWPRFCAKALAEDLGPILVFAPRRATTESIALELARFLPNPNPLQLTHEQRHLVGDKLAKMLKSRIAYHHSGLGYGARAGVIEPLAKAGQLRVVVATMGLAAGINFSLRSVALAGDSYRREGIEHPIRGDEILQMFGRAGRRGIDDVGYVLVSANEIRLCDARPCFLSRASAVDWGALLGIMHWAAENDRNPFLEAVRVQERLFTTRQILLGVEHSLKAADAPCGLPTDAERARHLKRRVREMLNSRGEWQEQPRSEEVPLNQIFVIDEPGDPSVANADPQLECRLPTRMIADCVAGGSSINESSNGAETLLPRPLGGEGRGEGEIDGTEADRAELEIGAPTNPTSGHVQLRSILSEPAALEKLGNGTLVALETGGKHIVYGRQITVADRINGDRVVIAKWVRRLTNWRGRQAPLQRWKTKIAPLVEQKLAKSGTPVICFITESQKISVQVALGQLKMRVPIDKHGKALYRPPSREVLPTDCAGCQYVETCRALETRAGTALLWRRLELVNDKGVPTRRGRIISFYHGGDGLGIAAALEDESIPIDELVYELANLRAGFRFSGDDGRFDGRIAMACRERYKLQSVSGYLSNGLPPDYGAGAEEIVESIHKNPDSKKHWVTRFLGEGDIDRAIIEWRSLLRQTAHAADLDWPRWTALQQLARQILDETESPTLTELPTLDYQQTRRVEHHLQMRRH